jgi:hypothetical protein
MSRSSVLVAFSAAWLSIGTARGQSLGSGHPGLKVVTGKAGAVAIYQDEPGTFGAGLIGGMKDRQVQVIVDVGYNFDKRSVEIPEQLFPLDAESAFSSSGGGWVAVGRWDYTRRRYAGYRLAAGRLTRFPGVQEQAAARYRLAPGDEFLGFVRSKVLFWRGFDPSRVYWREQGSSRTYCVALPGGVVDLLGAARGVKKDVALLTFRKAQGPRKYAPYAHEVIELAFSKGTCAP